MTRVTSRRSGFTLLELLVVTANIGLLAAILFPVFQSVRESARRTVCLSNLRQLGISMRLYAQDYDRFPHALDVSDRHAASIWDGHPLASLYNFDDIPLIHEALVPYVKNPTVWRCPSDTGFEFPDGIGVRLDGVATEPSCFQKYKTSYFYRTEIMFNGLSEETLLNPIATNVLFDGYGSWHIPRLTTRRERRYNVLFADGHVKTIGRKAMDEAWDTPLKLQ